METALYYLFSTISQTIAAAIALLAGLVLFRLQRVSAAIDEAAKFLSNNYYHTADTQALLQQHLRETRYELIRDYFRSGEGKRDSNQSGNNIFFASLNSLDNDLQTRARILKQFGLALGLTVGLIVVSVAAIPVTPWLAARNARAWVMVALVLVWLSAAVGSYARLALSTLK